MFVTLTEAIVNVSYQRRITGAESQCILDKSVHMYVCLCVSAVYSIFHKTLRIYIH